MKNQAVKIKMSKYPKVFNVDTPFWNELYNHYADPKGMNVAEFNLICSKRDISLWTTIGMKPHRNWKVSDVKTYFNLKGNKETLMGDFNDLWEEYQLFKKEMSEVEKQGKQIHLTC